MGNEGSGWLCGPHLWSFLLANELGPSENISIAISNLVMAINSGDAAYWQSASIGCLAKAWQDRSGVGRDYRCLEWTCRNCRAPAGRGRGFQTNQSRVELEAVGTRRKPFPNAPKLNCPVSEA
jgi:hypothetical protein